MAAPMVELRRVTKRFDDFTAVHDVSLEIESGEFLTLLGPSGCGKTTILRMLSGFETPTEGAVWLDGKDVTHVPPYERNVNQVFQSYALFPHLTVYDNIAFGLRTRGEKREELDRKVRRGIELVSLQGKEKNKPSALSGGQKQRVALARALVCEPKVLLLDEPLSALDAKLRHQMRTELKQLQRSLGMTFVFVTHDQEEALTLSDRIAVVNHGRIEQLGTAHEVYHAPSTRFVAEFIGEANILEGKVTARDGGTVTIQIGSDITLRVSDQGVPATATAVHVSVRPEKIHLSRQQIGAAPNTFTAEVVVETFRGQTDELRVRTKGGTEWTVVVANESRTQESFCKGDGVQCILHPEDIVVTQ